MLHLHFKAEPYQSESGSTARQEWNEVLLADDKVWDQNAFNDLFRRDMKFDGPEMASRIFRSVRCAQ